MEMGLIEARSSRASNRRESFNGRTLIPTSAELLEPLPSTASDTCCGEALRPFWADDGRYISVCMRCGNETTHKHMVRYNGSPWIGVDLDGTLARELPDSQDADAIGEPIEPMMQRVRQWLADGQAVKIFTARASVPRQIELVKQWLEENGLPDLEVTNAKDFRMIELWDDRAVQVARNSGQPLNGQNKTQPKVNPSVKIVARRRGGFMSRLRMFLAL